MVVVIVSIGAVVYGRHEGRNALGVQQRGLSADRAAVGSRLLRPQQAYYDTGRYLECLTYPTDHLLFGLELCFDRSGWLVEAVDRRGGERISSLVWARSSSPVRVSPALVDRAVRSVPAALRINGLLP